MEQTKQLNIGLLQGLEAKVVRSGHPCYVQHVHGSFYAYQAASCLLTPEPEDTVLVFASEHHWYILAILHQAKPWHSKVQVPSGLIMETQKGNTSITSSTLSLQSQNFQVTAPSCQFYFNHLHQVGESFSTNVEHLNQTADMFDQVAKEFSFQASSAFNWISQIHQLQTGYAKTIVEKNYRLDCEELDMYAQYDVKLDGEQVFLA